MHKTKIKFKLKNKNVLLETIDTQTYRKYFQNSIPINENGIFPAILIDMIEKEYPEIIYPHYYMALKSLFGESSELYDDYKSSFGYIFSLKVSNSLYTLNFNDSKGVFTFDLKKILSSKDEFEKYGDMIKIYQEPFDEFSDDDIKEFMAQFIGYLVGYIRVVKDFYNEEFVRFLNYHFLIYGYKDGDFFIKQYDYHDEDAEEKFYNKKKRLMNGELKPYEENFNSKTIQLNQS